MLLGNRPIRFKKYKVVVSELTHLGCSEWNECGGYRTRFQQGSCDDWQRPQLWQNVRTWWYRRAQWRGQICPACHSKCYRKVTCTSVPPIPLWEIIKMENQGPHLEWLNQKKKKKIYVLTSFPNDSCVYQKVRSCSLHRGKLAQSLWSWAYQSFLVFKTIINLQPEIVRVASLTRYLTLIYS